MKSVFAVALCLLYLSTAVQVAPEPHSVDCVPAIGVTFLRNCQHWAIGHEGQRKADLGDRTYLNPVMAGDHPDPSILKDGDDYYLTFSSFEAHPALTIRQSRDLVNWKPLGPALNPHWHHSNGAKHS